MCRITLLTVLLVGFVTGTNAGQAVYSAEEITPYPSVNSGGNYLFNYYLPPAGNASPWWVAWSADGTALFFSLHGSLWMVSAAGGIASEIETSDDYLSSPTLSPDGRFLAYTAEIHGASINLRVLDLETGRDFPVTEDNHINMDPAWSPDGRRLAFVSTRHDGEFHIYEANIDDGIVREIRPVTHDPDDDRDNIDEKTGRTGMFTSPTWTPDGKYIVFVWNRNAEQGSGGIWKIDVSKNDIYSAELIHQEESVYRLRPDVSPDGSRIVYSSYAGEQFNNLYLQPLTGGVPYKLTLDKADNFHPQWSPDGRRIAYLSNRHGTPALRIRNVYTGAETDVAISGLDWIEPRSRLTVRTIDADTGKNIATRIYNRATNGKSYAPRNEYHRVARRLGEHYYHSNGLSVLELPAGEIHLEAHHGFEYYPVSIQLDLTAGEDSTVTLELKRMSDPSNAGWFSGDNHVHMNYGGNLRNTPDNLVAMAQAEDVAIVNALVANKYTRIIDAQYFSGEPDAASTDDAILIFNQEYRPAFYGHISFLGMSEYLISPFTVGLKGTAIESLYPANTDVLLQASRQGALGGYVHPFRGSDDPVTSGLGGARMFPVDLALGTLGFHELTSQASWASYGVWHHSLNAGYRVPVVGGVDAITDLHRMYILGQLRTYAKLEGELSADNWIDAIRAGRTVVTNGPLLRLSIEEIEPGGELLMDAPGSVRVRGEVHSIVPLDHIELVINREVVALCPERCPADPDGQGTRMHFERNIQIEKSSWITLQAYSNGPVHPVDDHFVQATTNAIWVTVDKQAIRSAESIRYFKRWIEELTGLMDKRTGWRSEAEKERVMQQFADADRVFDDRIRETHHP